MSPRPSQFEPVALRMVFEAQTSDPDPVVGLIVAPPPVQLPLPSDSTAMIPGPITEVPMTVGPTTILPPPVVTRASQSVVLRMFSAAILSTGPPSLLNQATLWVDVRCPDAPIPSPAARPKVRSRRTATPMRSQPPGLASTAE